MKNRNRITDHREYHPRVRIGLFFILLGTALLVATNNMLHLGNVRDYFTWETAMIFVGALLFLNLRFIGGLLLIAGGIWFMLDRQNPELPAIIKTIYWPVVIIILGIGFIFSSLFKRKKGTN